MEAEPLLTAVGDYWDVYASRRRRDVLWSAAHGAVGVRRVADVYDSGNSLEGW